MSIEKWIEENSRTYIDGLKDVRAIPASKLRELLKTHAIVPVEECCDYIAVKRSAINWLKEKFPELCVKAGLCERVAGRLYTKTLIAASEAGDE